MESNESGFWRRNPVFTPSTVQVQFSGHIATVPAAEPVAAASPLEPVAGSQKPPSRPSSDQPASAAPTQPATSTHKLHTLLSSPNIDLAQLQRLSWKGIPPQYRSTTWQLLTGYLPLNHSRRSVTLQRKRREYQDWVQQTFAKGEESLDRTLWHQIQIDVPRTTPGSPLFQVPSVQRALERILYCWAARHPASGYVQGINDLLTPFLYVFVGEQEAPSDGLADAEADSFWCLTKLLDGIQDNYTHAQPGIQRQLVKLKDLVARVDQKLATHLADENVEFIQFAFRWINCLLMRELSLSSIVRMWDTYLSEPNGFSSFHIYVCAALLLKWSTELQAMDFAQIMQFLQRPPSLEWGVGEVELLLSEAYMLKCLYHDAPRHLAR